MLGIALLVSAEEVDDVKAVTEAMLEVYRDANKVEQLTRAKP